MACQNTTFADDMIARCQTSRIATRPCVQPKRRQGAGKNRRSYLIRGTPSQGWKCIMALLTLRRKGQRKMVSKKCQSLRRATGQQSVRLVPSRKQTEKQVNPTHRLATQFATECTFQLLLRLGSIISFLQAGKYTIVLCLIGFNSLLWVTWERIANANWTVQICASFVPV